MGLVFDADEEADVIEAELAGVDILLDAVLFAFADALFDAIVLVIVSRRR